LNNKGGQVSVGAVVNYKTKFFNDYFLGMHFRNKSFESITKFGQEKGDEEKE